MADGRVRSRSEDRMV